jgi:hypothetical protein
MRVYLILIIAFSIQIQASEEQNDLQKTLIELVHEINDITNPEALETIREKQKETLKSNEKQDIQEKRQSKIINTQSALKAYLLKQRINRKRLRAKRPNLKFNLFKNIRERIKNNVEELLTNRMKYLNLRNRLDTGINDVVDFDQLVFKTGLDLFEHLIPQADQL